MAEPKIGHCCYYLPELFDVRSIVRHQVYRSVGVTLIKSEISGAIDGAATAKYR